MEKKKEISNGEDGEEIKIKRKGRNKEKPKIKRVSIKIDLRL